MRNYDDFLFGLLVALSMGTVMTTCIVLLVFGFYCFFRDIKALKPWDD